MNNKLPENWYSLLSKEKISLEFSFEQWSELTAALQQLQVDRNQSDEYTYKRNCRDPIDSEMLNTFVGIIEGALISFRDQKICYQKPSVDCWLLASPAVSSNDAGCFSYSTFAFLFVAKQVSKSFALNVSLISQGPNAQLANVPSFENSRKLRFRRAERTFLTNSALLDVIEINESTPALYISGTLPSAGYPKAMRHTFKPEARSRRVISRPEVFCCLSPTRSVSQPDCTIALQTSPLLPDSPTTSTSASL